MPVVNGEKWACLSCIKGHRVSGCNHKDRELYHINPKGRPVKQCEHCRGARKSKSHHAKCDCGDKKDKLKDRGDMAGNDLNDMPVHDSGCQCHSGAPCVCGIKKEDLDLRLDTGRQTLHDVRAKPKLSATHSESHLTVFANGHHKPCHRNNHSAHNSGLPYKIPRPHTLHGLPNFTDFAPANNNYTRPDIQTTRSMDTHCLSNNDYYTIMGSTQRSADNLKANMSSSLDALPFQESLFTAQVSTFGQDGNSPGSNASDTFSSQQWPWTTTAVTPVTSAFTYGSLSTSPSQDCLPNFDSDWSIPSAGFNPLWSAGDLPLDPSKLSDSLTQPISHSGESKMSGPGLTVASSAHSEIEEPTLFGDLEYRAPQSVISDSLFWEDSPVYQPHASTLCETVTASTSTPLRNTLLNMSDLPSAFSKGSHAAPINVGSTSTSTFAETTAISMPDNFEDVNPVDPWSLDQNDGTYDGLNTFDISFSNTWL